MPTDAQRRNLASAHHAEVQALHDRIAALTSENTRLEGLVYTPGLWRCAKCNFVLVQRNLNANSGTITARDQPGDKCPNCDVNLWRITERENARDNYETAERLQIESNEANGFIALLEQQLAEAKRQMESQKDEWLAWDAKRSGLELDAARYRQLAKGEPLTVVVPTPTEEKPSRKVTIIYGPNSEPCYAEALGKAIDAAITRTQEQT